MAPEYTEMVAAIAIGVLSAIFISAFIILVLICRRQQLFKKSTYLDNELSRNEGLFDKTRDCYKGGIKQFNDSLIQIFQAKSGIINTFRKYSNRPEVMLISPEKSEVELNDVDLTNSLDKVLGDEQWVDDATGLIPHCLSILKTCRYLTERLTALAMNTTQTSGKGLALIVENARRISGRVDDMVKCMYPPLDPRLLEARAAALTLAVSHLVLIAKYECGHREKNLIWIDQSLAEMNEHMMILREASLLQEMSSKLQTCLNESKISV